MSGIHLVLHRPDYLLYQAACPMIKMTRNKHLISLICSLRLQTEQVPHSNDANQNGWAVLPVE